ncbi:MFS transporter [Burkholderia gladioli]|uniref:MFS transporter n=1 Tax=Burkholderia gladioli TaxID=28095 RepID=UPI001FC856CB|nr:MFS transporter [Burkholderia gladioli]
MINLDANIVAVSLSSIAKSLHADFAAIEWVISSYTLAFASLLMPAGALADRFGRKRILIIGLSIFTLASFFCGAASVSIVLNLARAMQGVGAALLLSAALAVLSHAFHGKERAKAFAFWGSVIGVAVMMGPVIGLVLVAAGLAVASVTVQLLSYAAVVVPMFVASLGGGILNGQVAKVSMTVIPVERAGMASGVAGTLRFSGLVLGFAALGAVLVDRIAADVQLHYPLLDAGRQLAMTRLILDGHLGDAASLAGARGGVAPMLEASLAQGYTGLLAVASALAFLAAALCWRLVDPLETRPLSNAAPVAVQALPE